MSSRLVLRACGRLVEIVGDDPALELARERLPGMYRTGRGRPERSWSILQDARGQWHPRVEREPLGDRPHVSSAVELVLRDMENWVAEHAERFMFVHAACVAHDGRAIMLPGLTLTGKTTLVRALIGAGAEYFSDEFAPVDGRGFVHPYPRPLAIRYSPVGEERLELAQLGAAVGTDPAQVALVALLQFDAAAGWAVAPLSRAHAILGLLDNTVPAQSRPVESLAAMERASKHARAIKGTRGEADEAAALLLQML